MTNGQKMNNKNQYSLKNILEGASAPFVLFWVITLVAQVLLLYVADESVFVKWFSQGDTPIEKIKYYSYLYHHGMTFLIFGSTLFLLKPLNIAHQGITLFKLGDWRWGLKWTLIICAFMTLPTWISSKDPQFLAEYPLTHFAFENNTYLAVFLLSYVLYYIGWESFYRGFMGYGLIGLGYKPIMAIAVQTALSCIIHIGKPNMELIGAIPGGIIFAVLAYRSGSLIWPIAFHLYLGVMNTFFCWVNQPI